METENRSSDIGRRPALKLFGSVGAAALGLGGASGIASADTEDGILAESSDHGTGGGTFGETFFIENGATVEQFNSFEDPDFPDIWTHRIHIGSKSEVYEGDELGDVHHPENRLVNDSISVTWDSNDIIDYLSPDIEEYVGAFESHERRSSENDTYEPYADAVISGATALTVAAAGFSTPTAVLTSMAVAYLTSDDPNTGSRSWGWDWAASSDRPNESATYGRIDFRQSKGSSVDLSIDVDAHANDAFSVMKAKNDLNVTLTAPDSNQSVVRPGDGGVFGNLVDRPSGADVVEVRPGDLSKTEQELLLGERSREILNQHGSLRVKADTTVGRYLL